MAQDFRQKLNDIIDANIGNPSFGAEELSRLMGMSQSSLLRKVRSLTGKSINQYIREVRLKKALEILQDEDVTVSEVTFRLGFNSPSYFSACFRKYHGQLPGEVKKKNGNGVESKDGVDRNEHIHNQKQLDQATEKKNKKVRVGWMSSILLVVIVSGYFLIPKLFTPSGSTDKSIAVLPFKIIGDDSTKQYRADGMRLAIQQKLGQISELRVIPWTTMEQYSNSSKTIKTIGRELKVDYVVEGFLQIEGNNDNLLVNLNNVKKDDLTFSENYSEVKADVFSLQSEVTKDLTKAIDANITREELLNIEKPQTSDSTAYEFYLLGNSVLDKNIAVEMYEKAIHLDSSFILAYVELAAIYRHRYRHNNLSGVSVQNRLLAKQYLDKAKALSTSLREVRFEEAKYYYQCKLDFPKALNMFQELKTEFPKDAEPYAWIGYIYNRIEEFEKSLKYLNDAISLNPAYWEYWYVIAFALHHHRLPESKNAEYYYLKSMELRPIFSIANRIVNYYCEIGEIDKAKEFLKKHNNLFVPSWQKYQNAWLEYLSRNFDKALKIGNSIPKDEPLSLTLTKHGFLGNVYFAISDSAKTRYHYSLELKFLMMQLSETPNFYYVHDNLRRVFAGLGMKDEALEVDMKIKDILYGLPHKTLISYDNNINRIAALVVLEDYDVAMRELDSLMKHQSHIYIERLKYHPRWDPVRNHPKFKEIISNPDYQLNF